ncbi:unnamed protein product [Musa acuminata var. zebrina]
MGAKIACVILLLILFAADVVVEAQQLNGFCKVDLGGSCDREICEEGCDRAHKGDGVCDSNNHCICTYPCPL